LVKQSLIADQNGVAGEAETIETDPPVHRAHLLHQWAVHQLYPAADARFHQAHRQAPLPQVDVLCLLFALLP